MIHLDFETRSEADLKVLGPWEYSLHPSTEVLCASWAVDDGPTHLWYPTPLAEKYDMASDEFDIVGPVMRGEHEISAFNSPFEQAIWENVLGFPRLDWFCSAAHARAYSIAGGLKDVALALNLDATKSTDGHAIMLKMCKPRRPSKKDPSKYFESKELLEKLGAYCRQDVEVEREIHKALPNLTTRERKIWRVDQAMNLRGFCVDVKTIDAALRHLGTLTAEGNHKIQQITGGAVSTGSQVSAIRKWCEEAHGFEIPNLQKDTVLEALDNEALPWPVRQVLEIRLALSLASVKKFAAMRANANEEDHRIRGTLMYSGAARTRRWSGRRIQPQNFVRGFSDPQDAETVFEFLKRDDLVSIESFYGSAMSAISKSLRGIIIAAPRHEFVTSDYSSIEARVTAGIAGAETLLDAFWTKKDVYIVQGSQIFPATYEEIYHREKVLGESTTERFFGKQAILGLGYGMGARKFAETCAKYGKPISEEFAKNVVDKYRAANHQIKSLWYQLERDAIRCAKLRKPVMRGDYGFQPHPLGVFMILPNGSERLYLGAKVRIVEKFDREQEEFSYLGLDTYTRKFGRIGTYGGKLLENLVQATSREIQADAILALEEAGYRPVLQVHDEIVCEVSEGWGSIAEVERLMATSSEWAQKWPIAASGGWRGKRFRK